MTPLLFIPDAVDLRYRDIKSLSHYRSRALIISYFKNNGFCEFCPRVSYSDGCCAMKFLVRLIFNASRPTKIVNMAIGLIPIAMGALHLIRWARPQKCLGYKQMDIKCLLLAMPTKTGNQVARSLLYSWLHHAGRDAAGAASFAAYVSCFASKAPMRADRVQTLIAGNWKPPFIIVCHAKENAIFGTAAQPLKEN